MTVYLASAGTGFADDLPGPWSAVHRVAPTVLLVDSDASLSRVYHELKWSLPATTPLLVVAAGAAKSAHVAAGTTSWLRERGL
ncbi:hypothetical protein [Jatrophihabitans fulvus]